MPYKPPAEYLVLDESIRKHITKFDLYKTECGIVTYGFIIHEFNVRWNAWARMQNSGERPKINF
jgi:hypothetical protein